jgi:hypothetical protein
VLTVVAALALILGIANFVAFMVENAELGGSAGNGYEADGRYFVSDHGRAVEVDETVWRRNRTHGRSVMVTHPLAMIGVVYLAFQYVFPVMLRRGRGKSENGPWPDVVDARPPLASGRCGGKFGALALSVPLVHVAVYTRGLWIKPLWMEPLTFAASEIRSVGVSRTFPFQQLTIEHRSPRVASPIKLFRAHDRIASMLQRISSVR